MKELEISNEQANWLRDIDTEDVYESAGLINTVDAEDE